MGLNFSARNFGFFSQKIFYWTVEWPITFDRFVIFISNSFILKSHFQFCLANVVRFLRSTSNSQLGSVGEISFNWKNLWSAIQNLIQCYTHKLLWNHWLIIWSSVREYTQKPTTAYSEDEFRFTRPHYYAYWMEYQSIYNMLSYLLHYRFIKTEMNLETKNLDFL